MTRPVWTNLNIKRKIRSLLGQRILGLLLDLVHDLKRKMVLPTLTTLAMPLMATGDAQVEIGDYASGETPTPKNPSEPKTSGNSEDADKTSSDDEYSDEDDQEGAPPVGIHYARVSSNKQQNGNGEDDNDDKLDEGSIEGQVEELEQIAEREGIELPYDPIVDEAESGTDFDRDGIQEVFQKAKRKEIDYLLVEKVDRVGRSAAETLYFIYILQSECNVTLLTSGGEQDVSETHGLMHTTLLSLMAEIQNELRTTKANKERIRGFLQKKNWKCGSPKIPLGYDESEEGWLNVNADEKQIVRDLFRKFADCENYSKTERYIDNEYGPDVLDGHNVKTVLQNSVYVGKPRLPESWLEDTTYENDLNEPHLHLLRDENGAQTDVSEETFYQVQKIIEDKNQQRSDDDTTDLLDFIEEYSLFAVVQGSKLVKLVHHCGEPLVKDGQVDLRGEYITHRYRCRHCEEKVDATDYYRRWPKEYELDQIRLIQRVTEGDKPAFMDK